MTPLGRFISIAKAAVHFGGIDDLAASCVVLHSEPGRVMESFSLHPQLSADCHLVGDLALSRVLLLNDRRYPWVVLVPRRAAVSEVYQLNVADRRRLLDESCRTGEFMMHAFGGQKLNVATLGNLVAQLHLHHVIRDAADPAWPGPVWGHSPAVPYPEGLLADRIALLRGGLGLPR